MLPTANFQVTKSHLDRHGRVEGDVEISAVGVGLGQISRVDLAVFNRVDHVSIDGGFNVREVVVDLGVWHQSLELSSDGGIKLKLDIP